MAVLERPDRRRGFIADTTALMMFFTTTGVISARFIAGMSWDQVVPVPPSHTALVRNRAGV
jgi:hypothetical protein